jgi:Fic family protein
MARSNGGKTDHPALESPAIADLEGTEIPAELSEFSESIAETAVADTQTIDDCLNALKALLSTVEKLQKVRLEVGDIKPFLVRMLDGEVMSGEELEHLKTGVGGLSRLIRAYSDHQTALTKAQPARDLLDQVLNHSSPNLPN